MEARSHCQKIFRSFLVPLDAAECELVPSILSVETGEFVDTADKDSTCLFNSFNAVLRPSLNLAFAEFTELFRFHTGLAQKNKSPPDWHDSSR